MFQYIIMNHTTNDVVESHPIYEYPHTAFVAARTQLEQMLNSELVRKTDHVSVGIQDKKGGMAFPAAFVREYTVWDLLNTSAKQYREGR